MIAMFRQLSRTQTRHCNDPSRRRGTTTVEFALVALPLFMFVFASIEMGRALMNINTLEEGARAGCRAAIVKNATVADIEGEVASILTINGIATYTVDYNPKPLNEIAQWEPITVTVSANFSEMSWLPMPQYLAGRSYTASATMPKETRQTLN
jgi:Flp pilus assembly protein TadG